MAMMKKIALSALAALVLAGPALGAGTGTITYRVKKGDNLYTLAERYFARTKDYRIVQRLNRVADPYRLPVGQPLVVPREILRKEPVQAVVQSYRGTVLVDSRPALVGMSVHESNLIETGQRSFVTLRLPDETTVALPSQTRVRVERMRRTLLANNVERSFAIEAGRARAKVTPMNDPYSDFRFTTPVASSAVRGTEFRMKFDEASQRASSEVLEGAIDFTAGKVLRRLDAGFGSASDLGAPVALLTPPDLVRPARIQDEEQLHFAVKPMPGAAGLLAQIALDAGFLDIIDEARSASSEIEMPGLPNGTYFVRVMGVDAHVLEGQAATYGFERRLNRLTTSLESSRAGRYRQYLFRWQAPDAVGGQYRFQLSQNEDGSAPIVDEVGLTTPSMILTDLPSGTYYWRVMTLQLDEGRVYEKWSRPEQLRIETRR